MSMEAQIYEILKGVPGVRVSRVQRLWRIRIGKRAGAREDGLSLARDMLKDWRALDAAAEDPREAIVAAIETLVEPEPVSAYMAEPEPIEMPEFLKAALEPEPPESIRHLLREDRPYGEEQERLMALYRTLGNKLIMGLASEEEGNTHTALHGAVHWFAKGAVEITGKD